MPPTAVELLFNRELCAYLGTKLIPLLSRGSPVSILEVGSGSGALAQILLDRYNSKVTYKAIDPSSEAIQKAKARGVNAECVALEDYKAPNDSFDVVLFTKSFHHLPSVKQAAQRAHQLLKPGGFIIADEFTREEVDTPTASFVFSKLDKLEEEGKFSKPLPSHYVVDKDPKQDYLQRWHSRFNRNAHSSNQGDKKEEHKCNHQEQGGHEHNPQHQHQHQHNEHQPGHGHGHGHEHSHSHTHGQDHGHQHGHGHGHGHAHSLATASEMNAAIKENFPNLEVTTNSYLYQFLIHRLEGSKPEEAELLEEFIDTENKLIERKEILQ